MSTENGVVSRSARRPRTLPLVLVAILLPCSGLADGADDAIAALGDLGARTRIAETPHFTFYSHFGFNLYDALLTAATARRKDPASSPLEGAEECLAGLVQEERSAWNAAVSYYAETVAATSDFSRERYIVRSHLIGFEAELDDDDRRDLALSLLLLRAAAPAYRTCGWSHQDAVNRRWIAALEPRLDRHADVIARRLEELFASSWRKLPIPVDVVATAGWAGADTIALPQTHIQISSADAGYQGAAALEMVFHEASHELVSPRNGAIASLLADSAREAAVGVDRNLWHGVLFTTVGEVTRSTLEAAGETGYQPVANGVFRGSWSPLREPLVEHWLPFVRGEIERETAAQRLVKAIDAPP